MLYIRGHIIYYHQPLALWLNCLCIVTIPYMVIEIHKTINPYMVKLFITPCMATWVMCDHHPLYGLDCLCIDITPYMVT